MANTPRREAKLKPRTPQHFNCASAGEIIPDSEEERKMDKSYSEVIELSSDEDDTLNEEVSLNEPFLSKIPGAWPISLDPKTPQAKPILAMPRRNYRARRIITSSDSEDGELLWKAQVSQEIIELSDSSPEPPRRSITTPKCPENVIRRKWEEEDDLFLSDEDDGSILTLNEPKSSRKPIRFIPDDAQGLDKAPRNTTPVKATRISSRIVPAMPSTPTSVSRTKPKATPRVGKKALAAAEQERRERYAQELFVELNRVIFRDGLPKETKLSWNKRLLTTAGRAKMHRSKEKGDSTEIELAGKILDCDERIRNTLAHEMCHLASWIIDNNINEGHGALWKAWAARVMRKRPEIDITTRHDYEISYPFEWKCEKCAKIYGRYSKSISPDACVCGVCKEGKLIPLFTQRAPKTPKTSRLAAARPQDSPRSLSRPQPSSRSDTGNGDSVPSHPRPVYTIHDSDSESDSDTEVLVTAMGSVTIIASGSAC